MLAVESTEKIPKRLRKRSSKRRPAIQRLMAEKRSEPNVRGVVYGDGEYPSCPLLPIESHLSFRLNDNVRNGKARGNHSHQIARPAEGVDTQEYAFLRSRLLERGNDLGKCDVRALLPGRGQSSFDGTSKLLTCITDCGIVCSVV